MLQEFPFFVQQCTVHRTDPGTQAAEIAFPLRCPFFCTMNRTDFFAFFAVDALPGTHKTVPAEMTGKREKNAKRAKQPVEGTGRYFYLVMNNFSSHPALLLHRESISRSITLE
jgi:hypothetical protein